MPAELIEQSRSAGLNVSQLAQRAVAAEIARLAKRDELDRYLHELERELGLTSEAERTAAAACADQVLRSAPSRHTA